jgi:HAD superfamily hydrolase (TIGR01509 family)
MTAAAAARTGAPGAVLLDLDGTLVDTTAAWHRAYAEVAAAHGQALPDGWWDLAVGRGMVASTRVLGVDPAAEPERARALADELAVRGAAALAAEPPTWRWRPGARALLATLRADGIPHAVVTAVPGRVAGPLLAAMGAVPDALVSGDIVARGKPAPDPYLHAARALGVAPRDCLVVEDSPTGVGAAAAAGMAVFVVPHAGAVAAAPGREVRTTLEGITGADLADLWTRLRSDASVPREDGAS